jgi:hypothetical protein
MRYKAVVRDVPESHDLPVPEGWDAYVAAERARLTALAEAHGMTLDELNRAIEETP